MLLEGWEQSTHEIIGRAVDSLSPGSSGDQKARLVLGLVAWENAKGKRVCQQRVRDTRKSLRGALNKCLKAKQQLVAPAEFCLPQVFSPTAECAAVHGNQGVLQGCKWIRVPIGRRRKRILE